jgi:hypothetical protein
LRSGQPELSASPLTASAALVFIVSESPAGIWLDRSSDSSFFLDQLGGIWEIIFCVTLAKPLTTGLKRGS